MKHRKIFQLIVLIFLSSTLVFIFLGIKSSKKKTQIQDFDATGREMVYKHYNQENQIVLQISCQESFRESNDKVLMKGLQATIFKKGKLENDVHIQGDQGTAGNHLNNFLLRGHVRISSKDLLLSGPSFYLKDRDILTSEQKVDYQAKTLAGNANKGMKASLIKNILYFYDTSGVYQKGEQRFSFQTDTLKYRDDRKTLEFRYGTTIRNKQSSLDSQLVILTFSDDHKFLKEVFARGNSHLISHKDTKNQGKRKTEIHAHILQNYYNQQGKIEKTIIKQKARIKIQDNLNTTHISSSLLNIIHEPQTETVREIECPRRVIMKNTGKHHFRINASTLNIKYNEQGEMSSCYAKKGSTVTFDKYQAQSSSSYYNLEKNLISLKGKLTRINYENYEFQSPEFVINTKTKTIDTSSGVKAIIKFEEPNTLFSPEPLFIHSQKMTSSAENDSLEFRENVNLSQREIELKASQLIIKGSNTLSAKGNVAFEFQKDEKITLKSEQLDFDNEKKEILLTDKTFLNKGDIILEAKSITIFFDLENNLKTITAEEGIKFTDKDLAGKSEKLRWQVDKEIVYFIDHAEIKKESSGLSKGQRMRLNLKDRTVTVLSDEKGRTKTIIE